jgi:hypothetical protein
MTEALTKCKNNLCGSENRGSAALTHGRLLAQLELRQLMKEQETRKSALLMCLIWSEGDP